MSDRLQDVLARARDLPPPPVACAAHAALVDRVIAGEEAWEAFTAVPDCPDCAAVIATHPYLLQEILDLPLPAPRVDGLEPATRRRWPRTLGVAVALAATLLLAVLAVGTSDPSATTLARPGPVADGAALYPFVAPPRGPVRDGAALYPFVPPPESVRERRFSEESPAPALPVAWRYEARERWL